MIDEKTEEQTKYPDKKPFEVMADLMTMLEDEGLSEEMAVAILIDTALSLVGDEKTFLKFVRYWVKKSPLHETDILQ